MTYVKSNVTGQVRMYSGKVYCNRTGKNVQCVTDFKRLAFLQFKSERKIITRWDKVKYFKKHEKELYSSS